MLVTPITVMTPGFVGRASTVYGIADIGNTCRCAYGGGADIGGAGGSGGCEDDEDGSGDCDLVRAAPEHAIVNPPTAIGKSESNCTRRPRRFCHCGDGVAVRFSECKRAVVTAGLVCRC
jgi:hypothetical protein